ncbi:MAG: hypothetical protein K1X67_02020 [Fimbriimonadaceae bacterium]|nr:hypothetical protein [Fimbriimonadaceae bacterium]
MSTKSKELVEVQNVNHPALTARVDAAKYRAMRNALSNAMPKGEPGLTQTEMRDAVRPHLPADLFPGGSTCGWWAKTVQLDLEAKGLMKRTSTKPARWWAAKSF